MDNASTGSEKREKRNSEILNKIFGEKVKKDEKEIEDKKKSERIETRKALKFQSDPQNIFFFEEYGVSFCPFNPVYN